MKHMKMNRDNVYYAARMEASLYDDRLSGRGYVSGLLGVSERTLQDYETGITKRVPMEAVQRMADIYNAPELMTHYCKYECPIGGRYPFATEIRNIEGVALRLIRVFDPEKLRELEKSLIDIAEDGKISVEEEEELIGILNNLDELALVVSEMKLVGAKMLRR